MSGYAHAPWPRRPDRKQQDRDAKEYVKTSLGEIGQQSRTSFHPRTPGDMKAYAGQLVKRHHLEFDSRQPSVVRKRLIDLLTEIGIVLDSFRSSHTITIHQFNTFMVDVQRVSDGVRDGEIQVTSRGPKTTLKGGANPCVPFESLLTNEFELEGHFLMHTPGVAVGGHSVPARATPSAASVPFSLRRHGSSAEVNLHDPSHRRKWTTQEGIKSDKAIQVTRADRSRIFMLLLDLENYPFGCAWRARSARGSVTLCTRCWP